jgi:urea-proton symporter
MTNVSSTGWVTVGIIWLFFSTCCVGIYPLWESRATIAHVSKAIFGDITGKPIVQGQRATADNGDQLATGQVTPEELNTKEASARVQGDAVERKEEA